MALLMFNLLGLSGGGYIKGFSRGRSQRGEVTTLGGVDEDQIKVIAI
jgi:hypothetical protein